MDQKSAKQHRYPAMLVRIEIVSAAFYDLMWDTYYNALFEYADGHVMKALISDSQLALMPKHVWIHS